MQRQIGAGAGAGAEVEEVEEAERRGEKMRQTIKVRAGAEQGRAPGCAQAGQG